MDRGTIAALFFLAILCVLPGPAMGHAFPDHSDPKVGAVVNGPPSSIRIWFDGALEPVFSTIVVQDSGGRKVDLGDGHVDSSDANLLEVNLPSLQPGVYRVIWNVVARDGHRTNGDYTFEIK